MNDLYAAIMSWAVTLSGYVPPIDMPEVMMVPHGTLVQKACDGKECKVLGWFPPGRIIYLDDRLVPDDDLYASSVLLHEMVHYLQQESGKYGKPYSCDSLITMEREAYAVQREYFVRYGVYRPIGSSMHNVGCALAAHQDKPEVDHSAAGSVRE